MMRAKSPAAESFVVSGSAPASTVLRVARIAAPTSNGRSNGLVGDVIVTVMSAGRATRCKWVSAMIDFIFEAPRYRCLALSE